MKRNWIQVGSDVHDEFITIKCATEKDAARLMQSLEIVYVEGQHSVIKSIAALSGTPMPDTNYS